MSGHSEAVYLCGYNGTRLPQRAPIVALNGATMPEPQAPSTRCPTCGSAAYEPEVMRGRDGTVSEGWFRCTQCRRYAVSSVPAKPLIPTYAKRRR